MKRLRLHADAAGSFADIAIENYLRVLGFCTEVTSQTANLKSNLVSFQLKYMAIIKNIFRFHLTLISLTVIREITLTWPLSMAVVIEIYELL